MASLTPAIEIPGSPASGPDQPGYHQQWFVSLRMIV
jgi:hypothetical protein